MSTSDSHVISQVVDTDRFPLAEPGGEHWTRVIAGIRDDLAGDGCSVLANFIRPECYETLREEGARVAPAAYYEEKTVNVYNIDLDVADLPPDHPGRITMSRGNAFVARDQIPAAAIIHRLYTSAQFQRFLADCFELPQLHELADPLSGLVLNVVRPGLEHPWHFDTNEFTVSMLTQEPQGGGVFEYCPNIRSAQAENLDDVRAVLEGRGESLIRRLSLRPGDLQLFKGRYALHRVSQVSGETARHSAIFAYSERPGVVGNLARTRQLFGRTRPEHLAEEGRVRVDQLMD